MRCGRATFRADFGLPLFGFSVAELFFIFSGAFVVITWEILRTNQAITGNFRSFLILLMHSGLAQAQTLKPDFLYGAKYTI